MKKVATSVAICTMVFSVNAEDVEVVEASASSSIFSSVYAGLGFGGNFQKNTIVDGAGKNRLLGSFLIGAGKQFQNNMYIGGEFLGDFARTISKSTTDTDDNTYRKASLGGFVPHAILRAGYVTKTDVLVYGKLGFSWRKTRVQVGDFKDSKRKAAFVLGAGVEKAFCKKFSAALEADYDFGYNWKKDYTYKNPAGTAKSDDFDKKGCGEGWNIRALVKYNVKY